MSDDLFSPSFPAGVATVINPSQLNNTVLISVESGTDTGTYYPHFSFTANTPSNSGSQYFIDPTKSQTKYTYVEVTSGTSNDPALTSFTIPKITVQ